MLTVRAVALATVAFFSAADARADAAPGQVVRDATEKIQAAIKQHHDQYVKDKSAFYTTVDQLVTPAFDVPYIAQITLGRAWRTATPDQRTRFQAAFKTTLIRAYSDALLENADSSSVDWLRDAVNGETASLRANVIRASGPPVTFAFELHKTGAGDWRAYDIAVEGVSLITNFRSQFAAQIKQGGLDALIARLEKGESI
ncbi:MAG TPA: ABC transporter substrate-binding protein [Nevskiaceae bacterium]|nr:ABC transporter substrate-binding protein [Nevskiaceae bacterium]